MHVTEVLAILRDRLRRRNLLQARGGIDTPANILLEIQDISKYITILEQAADESQDILDDINDVLEDVRDMLDIEYIAFN